MTPERWRRVKSALGEAMALTGAARAAYLASLGGQDPETRAEVESLLAAERDAGYSRTGEALEYRHDYADALPLYDKEHGLLVTLAHAAPHKPDLAHLLAFAELDMAPLPAAAARAERRTGGSRASITSSRLRSIARSAVPSSRRQPMSTRLRKRSVAATPHSPGALENG